MSGMSGAFRIFVIVLAVGAGLGPIDSHLVERWYSTSTYPVIQNLITPVSNLVPFALLDLMVAAALAAVVVVVVRSVLLSSRKRTFKPILLTCARLVTATALIYLLFLAIWGLNYRRVPMSERLVLDRDRPSSQAILELGRMSVMQLNTLHQQAHGEGWRKSPWRERQMTSAFESVLARLADARPAVPGRLKSSLIGQYFRWASVDGMINPFGLEAIANPDLLPFEKPFVAAHEWAHLAGYADESEASFVGFLTCIRAAAPTAYSGWLFLFWQINSEVGAADRKHLASALQEGPRQDIAAVAERVRQGQIPAVRDAGWRVYDEYLKANRVEEGVRSYGLVLTLLARARFEDGWVPVRRDPGTKKP